MNLYMRNRHGVVIPHSAELLAIPANGFTECLIDGSDVPDTEEAQAAESASNVVGMPMAAPEIPTIATAVTSIPDGFGKSRGMARRAAAK